MAFTSKSTSSVDIVLPYTAFGATVDHKKTLSKEISLTAGTGDNQGDEAWYSLARSLAATSETLDFAAGVTDINGNNITFTKIKKLMIINNGTLTGEVLTIGNATNPIPFFGAGTHTHDIGPGGDFKIVSPIDGWTVTAATADGLKLDSGANTLTYDIIVVGVSA